MKKLFIPIILLATVVLMGGCGSGKNVPYFQNIDSISLAASRGLYDAKIMPKDELKITVVTTNPQAAAPFNLVVSTLAGNASSQGNQSNTGGELQEYLVDNNGNINFPILGSLHVAGMTKTECENFLKEKIKPYLAASENPVITVRMSSYRVTVIGEVGESRVIPVTTEKMSIIEALASAGDLGIQGRRDNVLLVREDATGEKHAVRLNMNDANLFNSPYYYLQQNDIIYVEPNKVKARNSSVGASTQLYFTFLSLLSSIAGLVITVVK